MGLVSEELEMAVCEKADKALSKTHHITWLISLFHKILRKLMYSMQLISWMRSVYCRAPCWDSGQMGQQCLSLSGFMWCIWFEKLWNILVENAQSWYTEWSSHYLVTILKTVASHWINCKVPKVTCGILLDWMWRLLLFHLCNDVTLNTIVTNWP